MKNAIQMANRLREVMLNGRWVANTNFKHQLSSISWQQATQKVGTLNTIAALTFHVNYYIEGVIPVLDGGTLDIQDKYSFDLPKITSQEAWESLLNNLLSNAEQFANRIEQLPDEKLDEVFVDEKYGTYRRNIEGLIEHSYYHLGQISLLKKLIESEQA